MMNLRPNRGSKTRIFSVKSLAFLVPPAVCFYLGYWQIQRRRWKLDLLQRLEREISSPPVRLPPEARSSTDLPEYKCVSARGRFDHSREVLIGMRNRIDDLIPKNQPLADWFAADRKQFGQKPIGSMNGFFVVTPFILSDRPDSSILVNRGWVPEAFREPSTRAGAQVKDTVEVSGYIRYPEKPPLLGGTPRVISSTSPDLQHIQLSYYCRHIDQMADDLDCLPLFIDAKFDGSIVGGPIGGQTRVQLRNEHLAYILTWFSLGFAGSVMWIFTFVI